MLECLLHVVRKMTANKLKALLCSASSLAICGYRAHGELESERSERAQSCSCSIEISDTYVYIYIYMYLLHRRVKWTNQIAP